MRETLPLSDGHGFEALKESSLHVVEGRAPVREGEIVISDISRPTAAYGTRWATS